VKLAIRRIKLAVGAEALEGMMNERQKQIVDERLAPCLESNIIGKEDIYAACDAVLAALASGQPRQPTAEQVSTFHEGSLGVQKLESVTVDRTDASEQPSCTCGYDARNNERDSNLACSVHFPKQPNQQDETVADFRKRTIEDLKRNRVIVEQDADVAIVDEMINAFHDMRLPPNDAWRICMKSALAVARRGMYSNEQMTHVVDMLDELVSACWSNKRGGGLESYVPPDILQANVIELVEEMRVRLSQPAPKERVTVERMGASEHVIVYLDGNCIAQFDDVVGVIQDAEIYAQEYADDIRAKLVAEESKL
jgi:hypothetical protein